MIPNGPGVTPVRPAGPSLAGPGRGRLWLARLGRITPERAEPPPRGEEHPDDEHADAHPQVDIDVAGLGQDPDRSRLTTRLETINA